MKIDHLPENDATNGWSRILAPRTPQPALKGDIRADWLVVGAGYAGLAAARRLAENRPNDSIVVLDAGEAGENASGRNSGFGIDLPHVVGGAQDDLSGAHAYMRLARSALDHLEGVVGSHGIACDWSRAGKYQAATSARGADELLAPFAATMQQLGEPHRVLDRAATQAALGTGYYHASVYTPGCVLMNPAALTRGLADTLPGGVTLHENSPVVGLEHHDVIRAQTPSGCVTSPRMILAVNAFAAKFGFWRGRLLPFRAYGNLTRPLSPAEQHTLGAPGAWGVTPVNAFVSSTLRYTQDRRILLRHRIEYAPAQRVSAAQLSRARRLSEEAFRKRFPMLPDVTFEHTWTGYVCLSRNGAPGFGKVAGNVWSAVCQNAVGVTKGTIAGLLAADLATGRDNPLIADMESLGQPSRLPPEPFLGIGVRVRNSLDSWRGRHEA